jgi:hypothetical protein
MNVDEQTRADLWALACALRDSNNAALQDAELRRAWAATLEAIVAASATKRDQQNADKALAVRLIRFAAMPAAEAARAAVRATHPDKPAEWQDNRVDHVARELWKGFSADDEPPGELLN